jgi:hypothetical protein
MRGPSLSYAHLGEGRQDRPRHKDQLRKRSHPFLPAKFPDQLRPFHNPIEHTFHNAHPPFS